jgi:hypothetical protein
MRAKFIYEKFEAESDPVKDMNIGIKDYDDYIEKTLTKRGDDPNIFWDWFYGDVLEINSPEDLVELVIEVLSHTPLDYQIQWADSALEEWEDYKKDMDM